MLVTKTTLAGYLFRSLTLPSAPFYLGLALAFDLPCGPANRGGHDSQKDALGCQAPRKGATVNNGESLLFGPLGTQ